MLRAALFVPSRGTCVCARVESLTSKSFSQFESFKIRWDRCWALSGSVAPAEMKIIHQSHIKF